MGWFLSSRRSMSWRDQTLVSLSPPPIPLMVIFTLLMMFLASTVLHTSRHKMERRKTGVRFGLLLTPLLMILVINMALLPLRRRMMRYSFGMPRRPAYESMVVTAEGGGSSASPYMVVLVVLLLMVYFQSSFQSAWFRY